MERTPPGQTHRREVGRWKRWLRHGVAVLLLAAMVAFILVTRPAFGATNLSPTTVEADVDVAFAVTSNSDGIDVVERVRAEIPTDFGYVSCNAPGGWNCGFDGIAITWERATSLSPGDDTFGMVLRTAATSGDRIFALSDQTASGATSSSTAVVTVVVPEPEEPTESPSEEASETPRPEETAEAVVDDQPPPPVEPFRPPDGDDPPPISIDDLPDDESEAPAIVVDTTTGGGGPSTTMLVLLPVALLLLLSAGGFLVAATNR